MPNVTAHASYRIRTAWILTLTLLAIVLAWTAYLVREVLLLVYVSGLLAIGFSPAVRFIERVRLPAIGRRRLPRWLAILSIYLAIIAILTAIAMTVIPPLVQQTRDLVRALPAIINRLQELALQYGLIDHEITWQEAVQQAPAPKGAVDTIWTAVTSVVGGLFGLFTLLILTFYLLIDADDLLNSFLQLFPRARRGRLASMFREITVKVSAWLIGQLLLGGVIATTAAAGLWILGIPYFYVLALICGIGELIPMIGPILSAIPAVAVAFTVSPMAGLSVLLFLIAQQQFENHVLVPKIMSRQVGVSPVTVIVALLIGGKLLGLVGVVLAVPTAAIVQVMFQELVARRDALDDTLPE